VKARVCIIICSLLSASQPGEHISAIRVLDVLAWMDGKKY